MVKIHSKQKICSKKAKTAYPINGPSNVPSRQIPFPESTSDDPAEFGFKEHHPHLECWRQF